MKFKTLFAAMLIVFMAAGMAFAQEKKIDPYMSVRMWLGVDYVDAGGQTDFDFMEHALITSRLGFNGTLDKLSMKVEVGLKDNSYGKGLYVRHFYGKYKSGGLEVLFGQTWTPYTYIMGCFAGDFVGLGYGATFDGRLPMVKIGYAGLYIAAIQQKGIFNGSDSSSSTTQTVDTTTSDAAQAVDSTTTTTDYDNYMPKVAIGYEYKSDTLEIGPGFAINYTKIDGGSSVTSFIAYVHGKVKFGAPFIKFNATVSQNPGDFGIIQTSAVLPLGTNGLSGSNAKGADDVYVFEGFIDLGYKLGFGTASIGAGYVNNFETKDERLALYAQVLIPVQKYFKVVPTVLYIDHFEDQGRELVAGVKLQADI